MPKPKRETNIDEMDWWIFQANTVHTSYMTVMPAPAEMTAMAKFYAIGETIGVWPMRAGVVTRWVAIDHVVSWSRGTKVDKEDPIYRELRGLVHQIIEEGVTS